MSSMLFGNYSVDSGRNGWLAVASVLVPPVIAVLTLYCVRAIMGVDGGDPYTVLALLAFVITLVIYREMAGVSATFARSPRDFVQRSLTTWAIVIGCLAIFGFALKYGAVFSRRVLLTWAVVTPLLIAACQYWTYVFLIKNATRTRTVVIAGVSDLSRRLAKGIAEHPSYGLKVVGWFEDRSHDRVGPVDEANSKLLGRLQELPAYVRAHNVDIIYVALPIRREERTRRLLDDLHDTTASIYFVPDIFVFDLIQSRVDVIDGIPVLALCETPFVGVNGLLKRVTDVTFASLLLLLTAPILL
ncbi:MAG: undecaprenyl-phosphate glucose phosphotransferase, partial [Gammaproteobacteria bacterium]|nr:undecaprenyl-phosphate glucose phosphotransferase [Gammaproteobacteria bacterium]